MQKMTGSFKSLSDVTQIDDICIYSLWLTVKVFNIIKRQSVSPPVEFVFDLEIYCG